MIKSSFTSLPIDEHLEKISQLLKSHQNLVLKSSPGSGKTTRIPPYLLKDFTQIIVLEPRRIAAISACYRIAEENQWSVGDKVGYQVRFESESSPNTKILFLTEALLAKKLISSIDWNQSQLIILDEFHERSLWTDLCLGIIKEMQILGSPIKLLILSATIDEEKIKNHLPECAVFSVTNPQFPVEVIHSKVPFKNKFDEDTLKVINDSLKSVIQKKRQQILIFLPGVGEISRCYDFLKQQSYLNDFNIEKLHGQTLLSEQKRILRNEDFSKNIILSTNISESSVTINHIDTVIDTGLIKISSYNWEYDQQELQLKKISLSSAVQRQGRSHRQKPGLCFKMWTLMDEQSMEAQTPAEITRADLEIPLLFLSQFGVTDFKNFSWYESPSASALEWTEKKITQQNLLENNKTSRLGEFVLKTNLSPNLSLLLLLGDQLDILDLTLEKIILLGESASIKNNSFYFKQAVQQLKKNYLQIKKNTQTQFLIESFLKGFPEKITKEFYALKNAVTKLVSSIDSQNDSHNDSHNDSLDEKSNEKINFILEAVFIHKLCKLRDLTSRSRSKVAITTLGFELHLKSESTADANAFLIPESEYFLNLLSHTNTRKEVICEWPHFMSEKKVFFWVENLIETKDTFQFDPENFKLSKSRISKYFKIPLKRVDALEISKQEINEKMPAIIEENFSLLAQKNESLKSFLDRWNFFINYQEKYLKDTRSSNNNTLHWSDIITKLCSQNLQLKELLSCDWKDAIFSSISFETRNSFQQCAPLSWKDPLTQKEFTIYYDQEEPYLQNKLQAFLGVKTHPFLTPHKILLRIILLGPNYRPIQITKDLLGFWKSSYPEIRKELRGRYPKHSWPENPID